MSTPNRIYLRVYLNDHLAGAAAGIALARRALKANRGTPLEELLETLVAELELDKRVLESVMRAHRIPRVVYKQAGAVLGERFGRLKLNGALVRYSPLSRLVELEGLRAGVTVKAAMWETLLAVEGLAPQRESVEEALERARAQTQRLEEPRRRAAEAALVLT